MAILRRPRARVFLFPAIIAFIVGCGLASALLGDGIWDAVSWIALALPLIIIACYVAPRQSK
jgi:hypothetical protein